MGAEVLSSSGSDLTKEKLKMLICLDQSRTPEGLVLLSQNICKYKRPMTIKGSVNLNFNSEAAPPR